MLGEGGFVKPAAGRSRGVLSDCATTFVALGSISVRLL